MITNPILEEKYKTQKKLSNITKGNITKYKKLIKENIDEIEKKYKLKFKHRTI